MVQLPLKQRLRKLAFSRQIAPFTRQLRNLVNTLGYDIDHHKDPISDMQNFLHSQDPVIFDVGANVGQTVLRFREKITDCVIHSFEPSPTTFQELKTRTAGYPNLHLWNCGLGSVSGHLTLLENTGSDMSSFLPLGNLGWGAIRKETEVEIRTVDEICREQGIASIDVLKLDTQGFELEVLKGANEMIAANKIGLVYSELTFSQIYERLPPVSEILQFLHTRGFLLVSFYKFVYEEDLVSWTDALFIHKSYMRGGPPRLNRNRLRSSATANH